MEPAQELKGHLPFQEGKDLKLDCTGRGPGGGALWLWSQAALGSEHSSAA